MTNTPSDRELIELAKAGDQQAFTALYDRYERRVFNYAARIVRNLDVAQEVVQNTFLAVHQNLHQYLPVESASPWIFKIATNFARRSFRAAKRQALEVSIDQTGTKEERPLGEYLKTSELDPREMLKQKEYHEYIQHVLDALPEKYREVLILHDVEAVSYQDITRILRIPYKTTAKRLAFARVLFRKRIDPNQLGIQLFIFAQIKEVARQIGLVIQRFQTQDSMIALLVDGELSKTEEHRVRNVLQIDSGLRETLRLMEEAKIILAELPKLYPLPSLKMQVLDIIAKEPPAAAWGGLIGALNLLDLLAERVSTAPRPLLGIAAAGLLSFTSAVWIIQVESRTIPLAAEAKGRPLQAGHLLKTGDKIRLHDLIKTGPKEELLIKRPGLLVLNLKENTALSIDQISYLNGLIGNNEIKLYLGTFFFKSEPKLTKGDFKVFTPWFTAVNRGTVASFTLDPDLLRIAVLSGKLVLEASRELKNEYPGPIIVSEGEEFIYNRTLRQIIHRPISESSLKGLADFSSAEEIVLLGLPPKERAAGLVGKKQGMAFSIFNVKNPANKKKIDDMYALFQPPGPTTDSIRKATSLLRTIGEDYEQSGRPDINAKLRLVEASGDDYISDYPSALKRLKFIVQDQKLDPELRALAECAMGIVYEERLKDAAQARKSYEEVLKFKPDTSVSEEARNRLKRLK